MNEESDIRLEETIRDVFKEGETKSKNIITSSTAGEIENEFEINEAEAIKKVEASLFVAGRFLNMQELIMLTDLNPIMIREILSKLEKKYSIGVINVVTRNNAYKMDVAPEYHYLINKLATGSVEFTKSEQETLAVIAYKQPIKQSVIIKIRGNKSYDHVKKFRDLGLVVAKPEGHTLVLSLSEEFYEYFNVQEKEKSENIAGSAEKENVTEIETENPTKSDQ
ncbi:SMC-Scp complex subunit ScpB [archaeon]|nr:SMC-Scp complex subunit ScpB [archaeon]